MMATYRDSAVVLRVMKLGEADRIITLLSRSNGRIRAVAKGVRRTRSRFGGRLEPFGHVDVQLYEGRNLDTITQVATIDPFGSQIADDYGRYTAGTVIVETADRLASEDRQPWLRLYLLVVSALRALAEPADGSTRPRDPGLVMDAFLLRAMTLAGWAPALTECARCSAPGPHGAFQVAAGGTLCAGCRGVGYVRPSPDSLRLMEALGSGDWAAAESAGVTDRREAAGLVAALMQFHLERGLRSLPLVDRGPSPAAPSSMTLPAAVVGL